ncbi:hypothetical protein LCGC14_1550360 [marine sediment metagenome]|uniref:Uncharacterized protein n=1 Tax=marine sediment metagenome TaxID=412755 RepID=A0A0F9IQJ6_9ZZZZ|nr:MAG: hypothetical protein Lokiarch_15190 [Candidatus Lokiarchaeum sp. GC14_75]
MMTTPREKEGKKEEKASEENFFFDDSEEIILTDQEIQDLEKKLENMEIDDKTRTFFKSSNQFFKKLEENEYIIALEEIEKL